MNDPIREILLSMTRADVRYLVVGGVAVVMHGHLRLTADLDLVIDFEESNLETAMTVFERRGFRPVIPVQLGEFTEPEKRLSWIREKNMLVFSLWHPEIPGLQVDLFVTEPFPFDEAYDRALAIPMGDSYVKVAAIEDLIQMKLEAGRAQDLMDVEALRKIERRPGKV